MTTPDLPQMIIQSVINGIPQALQVFGEAIALNPLPWIAIAAFMAIGAIVPSRRRRKSN